MTTLQITILDPDTKQAVRAAQQLNTSLKNEGLSGCVQAVTCYLEIARRGLCGKTPVIAVDDKNFQCNNLSTDLLAQFAQWLSKKINQ